MDSEDENITTLLNMGFPDIGEIKQALRVAKNDLNEAVAFLTNDRNAPSYDPMDVQDVEVEERSSTALVPFQFSAAPASETSCTNQDGSPMEFPTTNLYELQDRVFAESWSIPYKKEESLGKCLIAAARLAEEGLCDADENCKKFIDRCMPEAFKKLLTSGAVRRWCAEIQEGIFNMCDLLLDLVVARLKHNPVPENILCNVLATVFDPDTEWNMKNKSHKSSSGYWDTIFTSGEPYACSPTGTSKEPYGWLVDLINKFAHKGGFELIRNKFDIADLQASAMAALLLPLGVCAEFLNTAKVCPFLLPCIDKAIAYVKALKDDDLKSKRISSVSNLLNAVKLLSSQLWPSDVESVDTLLLEFILRMLRTPHFNARMNGLKEIDHLIDNTTYGRNLRTGLDANKIQDWLAENKVLSIVLEGNIDHVQYTDRIKAIVEFLGPRLSLDELTKIWKMQEGQNNQVVDNIYSLIAAASAKLNAQQFDHLFSLIQKSWGEENERTHRQLLSLIGKIGREAWPGKTSTKVLDLLWDLAHLPSLPTHLVEQALEEHTAILGDATFKDQVKKNYFIKCIEEIKKGSCVLPALKQLFNITKSIVKTSINKQDKATLSDLNKIHEIVKLITCSLVKCYKMSQAAAGDSKLTAFTVVDGRYTHAEYVNTHLQFLQFVLQEGDSYLGWNRCKDIWDTFVANADACEFDREVCCEWFSQCLRDLETDTQMLLFQQKLLKLDPTQMNSKMFHCFKTYFESVNINDHRLRHNANGYMTVEKLELIGADYFWQVALYTPDEVIANVAIDNILELSYVNLAPRLKKDVVALHRKFINDCYKRLESSMMTVCGTAVLTAVSSATKTLTALAMSEMASLPLPSKPTTLQNIRRLLLIAERYISTVEEAHPVQRCILPHGASFFGYPFLLRISCTATKSEFSLLEHSNATLGSVRMKIAQQLKQSVDSFQITCGEHILAANKDRKLLCQLDIDEEQCLCVKPSNTSSTTLSTSSHGTIVREVRDSLCLNESEAGPSGASLSASSCLQSTLLHQSLNMEQEKMLPGVIMAMGGQVFELLYQISELEDSRIIAKVRSLLHLIPTDPSVQDSLDSLMDKDLARGRISSSSSESVPSPTASPRTSPKKINLGKEKETSREMLKRLFDASTPGMSTFRVLYNLEVLSGRLMPTTNDGGTIQSAKSFREEFLNAGGLDLVIKILQKDAMLPETDYDIRQCCYLVALQLARFLLCGQTMGSLDISLSDTSKTSAKSKQLSSDLSISERDTSCNISSAASRAIQTMGVTDFTDTVSCFLRVAWAAAAGKLHLVSTVQPIKETGMFSGTVAGRSRQSSTGSNTSTGSEGEHQQGLQAGICTNQKHISSKDFLIAREALEFLVTCLKLRSKLISTFYNINCVGDFVIDMLLSSPCGEVRSSTCKQFCRLGQIDVGADLSTVSPRHFLLQVLLKAPLPLWVSTTNTRGTSQRLLSQCSQYFELLCFLLQDLSAVEQKNLHVDPSQMLEDEIAWLTNFTPSESLLKQDTDNSLLAGHLRLMRTLFTCEGVDKGEVGKRLIPHLLNTFLFPASRLIIEGFQSLRKFDRDFSAVPKCLGMPFRAAAYELLVELATKSAANSQLIVELLLGMHHKYDPSLAKEFEYEPAVEGRAVCGYVGLKNAGATCYVNSVIEQLFMVPGLWEAILAIDEESLDENDVFYQFQMVLGHLLESKLQYYVPNQFLKCFKLWGQPVNVREQQDAFEFFTHLIDQVDEAIKQCDREPVFKRIFEGLFSDQKICQDCPHRYEREEAFMALNLTVKSHDLLDSLDQFVKGELLEGDNAYFCEKCGLKRNTVKRTCIKRLPSVLVVQLKRFGYDWEANRALKFDDHFKFPWALDMGPYTESGIQTRDKQLEMKHSETGGGDVSNISVCHSSSSPNVNTSLTPTQANYELVGVVVHSGQASAGHFYSYIKERRGTSLTNPNKNKWFKFNDTTVEEFDMNDATLEAECFGGTYKAKVYDSSNSYPETRHRYWNGYMLFYERIDDVTKTPRTPKRNWGRRSFRKVERDGPISTSTPRKPSTGSSGSVGGVVFSSGNESDGLSQLTALVHHGEKQGLFTEKIPPRILRVIQEDNLRFFRNRDIYCEEYYSFVHQLITCNLDQQKSQNFSQMSVVAMELAVNFLFNTYLRTRRRQKEFINQWVDSIETLVNSCKEAAFWLVDYLASETGLIYIKPFLLECPVREVRIAFARIVEKCLQNFFHHGGNVTYKNFDRLIEYLLEMLEKDVPDNCRTCTQYFHLMSMYAQMGGKACLHLFERKAFVRLLTFLLGPAAVSEENQYPVPRRWGSSQAREFSALHTILAVLVLSCNLETFRTQNAERCHGVQKQTSFFANISVPAEVQAIINGHILKPYLREVVTAYREITVPLTIVDDMLEYCSFCNQNFSDHLIHQIMLQCSSVSCNELKQLFDLLFKILMIDDPWQLDRLRHVIDGVSEKCGMQFDGMLAIIRNNHAVDSRRSYQCIKFLVHLANKSATAKDFLMQTPSKWQWAVNWLKKKMSEHSYWGSQSTAISNEDPNAKSFQRTVSAQDTLAEATALLTELDYPDLEMDTDGFEVDEQDEDEREKTPNGSETLPNQTQNPLIDIDAIDA